MCWILEDFVCMVTYNFIIVCSCFERYIFINFSPNTCFSILNHVVVFVKCIPLCTEDSSRTYKSIACDFNFTKFAKSCSQTNFLINCKFNSHVSSFSKSEFDIATIATFPTFVTTFSIYICIFSSPTWRSNFKFVCTSSYIREYFNIFTSCLVINQFINSCTRVPVFAITQTS